MSSVLFSLPEFYNSYKLWVSKNPQSLGDWETSAKWVSYFIAGRINNSHVVSELVYCLSNLLVMFNDRIIQKTCQSELNSPTEKLKLWLTVIEYSEVFCELSAKKLWGTTGKWIVIVAIQVFKCIARILLIYKHKENIVQNPPIPVLDRKIIKEKSSLVAINEMSQQFEESYTLKRSGRIVRKVDSSPPISLRPWKPLQKAQTVACDYNENEQTVEQTSAGKLVIAESIYIAKPIVHLASMVCFGSKTWKPWMISLVFDLASLHLYRSCKTKNIKTLTAQERLQLSRRTVVLLLYLLRTPFYEKQSKDRIDFFLAAIGEHIPLAGFIANPLRQYLPFWQSTYFYMWST